MLGNPTRHRGRRRREKPRDLQVCWANVGKGTPHHIAILHIAYTEQMDVVCIQEPATYNGKT